MNMRKERFDKIMNSDVDFSIFIKYQDNTAFLGLQIIRKYLPTRGIEDAGHEIIYSVNVDQILEAGITEEDAVELRSLNWMIENNRLACFV